MAEYSTKSTENKIIAVGVTGGMIPAALIGLIMGFDSGVWPFVAAAFVVAGLIYVVVATRQQKQARGRALASKRPNDTVIDGKIPAMYGVPITAPKEDLNKAEDHERNASLVITPTAFEIWVGPNLSHPMRTIQNRPGVTVKQQVRDFGNSTDSNSTGRQSRYSIVIANAEGQELVFSTSDLDAAQAKVEENLRG